MKEIFRQVATLAKLGDSPEALKVLRDATRRGLLDAEGIEKAGRLCRDLFGQSAAKGSDRTPSVTKVLLLGQCTTSWLSNVLTAVAWGQGVALSVSEGAYDNVMQELLAIDKSTGAPDVIVLLPWNQRLLFGNTDRPFQQRVDDEVEFWAQALKLISNSLGSRIVQVSYDWVTSGALGHAFGSRAEGDIALVRRANEALRQILPDDAIMVDLEQISGVMGRERFYDARRYMWTKQPFSESGTVRLAEHIWSGIRALKTGPKKVLVLDLDNTLWGGVVGETGPLGVELGEGPEGEAFRAFQEYIKRLAGRGVVLTVCSKNNPADARAPFEQNPNMALSLDDFAHIEASWDPKTVGIRRTAELLQLGLDSFVFFDDNPAEREHVRQLLWDVEVVEVPQDPADYIRALDASLFFETVGLTGEDGKRSEQYRTERHRREAEVQFESMDGYLASLEMSADVRPIAEGDLSRVVQLIGKTNQFNLTTRRHSTEHLRQLLGQPGAIGLTLRVADRFGDHGLVSVMVGIEDPGRSRTLEIDTWLMSCRVISRTVEEFFFNAFVEAARARGIEHLVGRYLPTSKNMLVKTLYGRLGFTLRVAPSDPTGITVAEE